MVSKLIFLKEKQAKNRNETGSNLRFACPGSGRPGALRNFYLPGRPGSPGHAPVTDFILLIYDVTELF